MRGATVLLLAAVLAAPAACGGDDPTQQSPAGDARVEEPSTTTPGPTSTSQPAPDATADATPEKGDELPKSPPKAPRAERFKAPTVRYDGTQCTPETVNVGERGALRVRNRSERSMRFRIPDLGLDIRVRGGTSMNLLVPEGRRVYVCSSGGASAEGVVDVAGAS